MRPFSLKQKGQLGVKLKWCKHLRLSNVENKTFLRGVWPQQKASHFIIEHEYSCGNYLGQCLIKMDFVCRWVPPPFNRLAAADSREQNMTDLPVLHNKDGPVSGCMAAR